MQSGTIIILNGTSSAGKSTLAKALQAALPDPYLGVGIDTVVFALPKRYLCPPHWSEVFRYIPLPDREDGAFDFTVDTSQATPEECAAQIIERIQPGARSQTLVKLRENARIV